MSESSSGGISVVYPESLPTPQLGRRHTVDPRLDVTKMESNRLRIRRIHIEEVELMDVEWNFTLDQYETFRQWFIEEINSGVDFFIMITFDLVRTPGYYVETTRELAFLDGTYSMSQSDGLVNVTATLILDSESEGSYIRIDEGIPDPPPEFPDGYEITYSACRDEITFTFPEPVDALLELYHSASETGPWTYYTTLPTPLGGRTSFALSNYFAGERFVQVRGFTVPAEGEDAVEYGTPIVFFPLPPLVEPPVVVIDNLADSDRAFPSIYRGGSGDGNESAVYVVGEPNKYFPIESGRPGTALAVVEQYLFSDALIEVRERRELRIDVNVESGQYPQAVTLTPVTAGSSAYYTIDGTDPVSGTPDPGMPFEGIHGSGDTAGAQVAEHSRVLIARAFKDGCKSPPIYIAIDVTLNVKPSCQVTGLSGTASVTCNREVYFKDPGSDPACVEQVSVGTCAFPYNGEMQQAAAEAAAAGAGSSTNPTNFYFASISDVWNQSGPNWHGTGTGACPETYLGGFQQGSADYYAMTSVVGISYPSRLSSAPSFVFGALWDYPGGEVDPGNVLDAQAQGTSVVGSTGSSGDDQPFCDKLYEMFQRSWPPGVTGTVPIPPHIWFRTTIINDFP